MPNDSTDILKISFAAPLPHHLMEHIHHHFVVPVIVSVTVSMVFALVVGQGLHKFLLCLVALYH